MLQAAPPLAGFGWSGTFIKGRRAHLEHDANSLAAGNVRPHERTALGDAKEFLQEVLADGPVMANQVFIAVCNDTDPLPFREVDAAAPETVTPLGHPQHRPSGEWVNCTDHRYRDARDAGHTEITVRRAKTELRIQSEKQGAEGWEWRLPDDEGDHDERDDQDEHVDHVDHLREEAMENLPYLREGDQGAQDDHADHGDRVEHVHLGADKCVHGYASGEGCYCCDPNHPYRLKKGVP
jgi:hypothetical protein